MMNGKAGGNGLVGCLDDVTDEKTTEDCITFGGLPKRAESFSLEGRLPFETVNARHQALTEHL